MRTAKILTVFLAFTIFVSACHRHHHGHGHRPRSWLNTAPGPSKHSACLLQPARPLLRARGAPIRPSAAQGLQGPPLPPAS